MRALKNICGAMTISSLCLSGLPAQAQIKLAKELPAKAVSAETTTPVSPGPSGVGTINTVEGAYLETYQTELQERKKTEDLEKKAADARANDEARRGEIEREISIKKMQIEDYKRKQGQLDSEIKQSTTTLQGLETELNTVEQELGVFRQSAEQQLTQTDQQKKEYQLTQKNLDEAHDRLRTTKAALTKSLYDNKMEIQRLKAEVSQAEVKAEALEAQKQNIQADEAKVRVEAMSLRTSIEDKNAEIAKLMANLEASKRKFEQAKVDLASSALENRRAEAKRNETQARVTVEVRKYEDATIAAMRSKSMSESEKIRLEAETEKIKAYVAMVKKASNEAIDASMESQASVMESRLALQTAKSELSQEVAHSDKNAYKKEKVNAQLRQLASAAEASDMIDGARPWIVSKACRLHKRASSSSDEVSADITVGQKLIGAEYSPRWIKVLNSSGAPAFIKKDCGNFESN
jgi:hypothetical protein